jgi:hypothetical protein
MNSNFGNSDIGSSSSGKNDSKSASSSSSGNVSSSATATGSASRSGKEQASGTEHGVDIKKYLDDAKSMGKNLESQMTTRPYVVLGAVAGVSFVAGSLLGSRLGQLAVAIGIGYAATHFLQDTDVKSIARKATQNL